MITKNFTETVVEMILKTDTEMIGCLPKSFPACFTYLLIYWHQWQFSAFAIFHRNSSLTTSRLCDRMVNAHLHFLLWAGRKL